MNWISLYGRCIGIIRRNYNCSIIIIFWSSISIIRGNVNVIPCHSSTMKISFAHCQEIANITSIICIHNVDPCRSHKIIKISKICIIFTHIHRVIIIKSGVFPRANKSTVICYIPIIHCIIVFIFPHIPIIRRYVTIIFTVDGRGIIVVRWQVVVGIVCGPLNLRISYFYSNFYLFVVTLSQGGVVCAATPPN